MNEDITVDLNALPQAVRESLIQFVQAVVQAWPSAPGASDGARGVSASTPRIYEAPRRALRRRIVALLQQHEEGLSPAQIRDLLGLATPLNSVVKGMARDGLICRVAEGLYIAGTKEEEHD